MKQNLKCDLRLYFVNDSAAAAAACLEKFW